MATQPDSPKRDTPAATSPGDPLDRLRLISPMTPILLALKASRNDCSCEICVYLREIADALASAPLSAPQSPPTPPGGNTP